MKWGAEQSRNLMSRTRLNLLANFAGVGWTALMQLAFVPLYIRFLGIEAFGLIGFYLTLQGALQVLDLGLSPTMNREMARYSVGSEKPDEMRDFVRTLEVGYWAIGIALGAALVAASPFIAAHWIRADSLPRPIVRESVIIMGVMAALQWPLSLYYGGLMGLQRQGLSNGIKIVMTTVGAGGVVLVLWLVSRSITAFLLWHVFANAIHVSLVTLSLWRSLPPSRRTPHFDPGLIRNVWHFAAGMSGITITGLILTQLDKVILSKLLDLRMFGYYMLATAVGNGLYVLILPVFNTVFPRFSTLAALGDEESLSSLYHRSAQLLAVLVLPVACLVAFFSFDILLSWTGNIDVARNAAPIAAVLVVGTSLNGLMNLPYALQLAYGWTTLGLRINVFLILILVPAIFLLTSYYGPVGAASVWLIVNAMYMLIGVPLTHRRLLKGGARGWFQEDVGLPLVGAILGGWLGWGVLAGSREPTTGVAKLIVVLLGAFLGSALAAPRVRLDVLRQLSWLWATYFEGKRQRLK